MIASYKQNEPVFGLQTHNDALDDDDKFKLASSGLKSIRARRLSAPDRYPFVFMYKVYYFWCFKLTTHNGSCYQSD